MATPGVEVSPSRCTNPREWSVKHSDPHVETQSPGPWRTSASRGHASRSYRGVSAFRFLAEWAVCGSANSRSLQRIAFFTFPPSIQRRVFAAVVILGTQSMFIQRDRPISRTITEGQ